MDPRQLVKPLLLAAGLGIVLFAMGVPVYYLVLLLVIVACPLMMFFMMRGMDHSGATDRDRADEQAPSTHEHH